MEHGVSDTFIERLSAKLGHPVRDPHGDPIPGPDGRIELPSAHRLAELDSGHRGQIIRISDENPSLLRYLDDERIELDAAVEVVGRRPFGGALVVRFGAGEASRELDVSDEVGSALWVSDTAVHQGCALR